MRRFRVEFEEFYAATSADIYMFCAALNFTPHWQQCQLFDVVQLESTMPVEQRKKQIAVKSGQGPGKTAAATVIALWRTWRAFQAVTFITAPTQHQVRDVFLAECRRWIQNAHPIVKQVIEVTKTRVVFNRNPNWGIWTVPASRPEAFAGRHEKHMTIICDEASGIETEIMQTIQGTLTNADSLWLNISNPTSRQCYFYEFFTRNRERTHCITFNAEETPESEHFSKDAQRKIAAEYGRHSDVYAVRVLGEFPGVDPNAVMGIEDLEACTKTNKLQCVREARHIRTIGIDLARFGSDESVIVMRSGNAVVRWEWFVKQEPVDILKRAVLWQKEAGWANESCWFIVDASGLGEGAIYWLYEDSGRQVFEFKGAGKSTETEFENKITQAYFQLGRKVRQRCIYLPDDNHMLRQLSSRVYKFNPRGKIMLEPKEQYVKRLDHSPDRADAVVLAFYDNLESRGWVTEDREDSKRVGAEVRW